MAGGLAGMVAFGAVFLLAGWGMKAPELEEILGAVGRRLGPARRLP
jgi:hypothetical protein